MFKDSAHANVVEHVNEHPIRVYITDAKRHEALLREIDGLLPLERRHNHERPAVVVHVLLNSVMSTCCHHYAVGTPSLHRGKVNGKLLSAGGVREYFIREARNPVVSTVDLFDRSFYCFAVEPWPCDFERLCPPGI